MNSNNNLVPIQSIGALDNLPKDRLKRVYADRITSPVKKTGIQITSTGVFVGYDGGHYERQVIEIEFYKK